MKLLLFFIFLYETSLTFHFFLFFGFSVFIRRLYFVSFVSLLLFFLFFVYYTLFVFFFFFFFFYFFLRIVYYRFVFLFFLGLSALIRQLLWVNFVSKLGISFYETLTNVSFLVFCRFLPLFSLDFSGEFRREIICRFWLLLAWT